MALTKKAMVLFDDQQYKRLEQYAKKHNASVGSIIRESVEAVISGEGDTERRRQAALKLTSVEEEPVDWDKFEKAVAKGHAG